MQRVVAVVSLLAVVVSWLAGGAAAQEATPGASPVGSPPATPVAAPAASPVGGAGGVLEIMPLDRPAFGRTTGEWAAAWRRWSADPAHTACGPSDNEDVWFLPAVPVGAPDLVGLELPCALPAGKAVFYAVIVNDGPDVASCDAGNEAALASVGGLGAITVDLAGRALAITEDYRVDPAPLPTDAAGAGEAAVACGYAFVLAPLPAGGHVLRTTVEAEGTVLVDIVNEVTVE